MFINAILFIFSIGDENVKINEVVTETYIEIFEGDLMMVTCYAERGYPPAHIHWQYEVREGSINLKKTNLICYDKDIICYCFLSLLCFYS